jgi:hypothetical protein
MLLTRKPPNLFEATTVSATQNISPPVEHVLILSLLLDVFDGPGSPNDAGIYAVLQTPLADAKFHRLQEGGYSISGGDYQND